MKTNFIAPGAHVIGDVTLEENVTVWFNAVIRGDAEPITIGKGSNVQDNCTLHSDLVDPVILGEHVSIGHNSVIHGCTIGNNTLIGMGSIILNGAVIGANCIVGAGSLVTGKFVVPDNSLVLGSPAKVVRQLTADEVKANYENALHYIVLAERYR